MVIPNFNSRTIGGVYRVVGKLYTGSQLTESLAESRLGCYKTGVLNTKWVRVMVSLEKQQRVQEDNRTMVKLLSVAFNPRNLLTVKTYFDPHIARDAVNAVLS